MSDKGLADRASRGSGADGTTVGRRFRIGDLVLDTGRRAVFRDGRTLALPKLSYRLLVVLSEAAPDVVTHDQIVERVWPRRVISPETVTQRVRLLRRALDDDAQTPCYIGLARGQGYQLLPLVEELADVARSADRQKQPRHRAFLAIAATLGGLVAVGLFAYSTLLETGAPPLPDNTVVVLPFVNASENVNDDYISDGLADDLRDQLARVAGLKVSARASSLVFQDEAKDARAIARLLGVRWLIEGTVRRADDRVSITVQIVDGTTGFRVHSQRFDRSVQNLLAMQQDIASQVVAEIHTDAGQVQVGASVTENISAFEMLLLARQLEQQVRGNAPLVDLQKLDRAIRLYREATLVDPHSALSWSRLAGALLYRGDIEGAKAPIEAAVRIDPDLSEVQYTLGLYYWRLGNGQAGDAFQRAVDLNPNNADAIWELAKWEWHKPDVAKAGELFRRGLTLDPLSLSRYADLGNYYGVSGHREEALAVAQRIQDLFPDADGDLALARIYEVTGALDQAIAWATRAWREEPDVQDTAWQLAELYARIGAEESAKVFEPQAGVGQLFFTRHYGQLIDRAEELILEYPGDLKLYYLLGFAYNAKGQHERAARILDLAGLPESALSATRKADAIEALATLMDSMQMTGRAETARQYADWLVNFMQGHIDTGAAAAWWPNLYQACALSVLGEDERALSVLTRIDQSPGLARYPILKDAQCFRRLSGYAAYQQTIARLEERRRLLRESLPATLAQHGLQNSIQR